MHWKSNEGGHVLTQENDNGIDVSPQRLRLLRVKREADPVGAVEVAEQALAGQRQEGDHEAEHPDPQEDGDGAPPARRQVLERVDDADVLLQSEVGEQEHRHLGGQHGQGADDLALNAVHPGLSVPVVLAAELQVVCANHEEVDPHQPVGTCTEGGALPHDIFSSCCSTKVSSNPSQCTALPVFSLCSL